MRTVISTLSSEASVRVAASDDFAELKEGGKAIDSG